MKKILKKPEPKFDIDSTPDIEPKYILKQKTDQEEVASWQPAYFFMDICMIGATPLTWLARKPEYIIFAVTMADIKKALILKKYTDFATKVPVEHYKHLNVFL